MSKVWQQANNYAYIDSKWLFPLIYMFFNSNQESCVVNADGRWLNELNIHFPYGRLWDSNQWGSNLVESNQGSTNLYLSQPNLTSQKLMVSNPDRVKPMTYKFILVAT